MIRPKKRKNNRAITSKRMMKIKAAGGVIVRKNHGSKGRQKEVLLIRRNGVWDLPKGKLEESESIEECAIREVEEETGVKPLQLIEPLCETFHTYSEGGTDIKKSTQWYLMKADQEDAFQKMSPQGEEGITDLRWESVESASALVQYDNLKLVMQKVAEAVSS